MANHALEVDHREELLHCSANPSCGFLNNQVQLAPQPKHARKAAEQYMPCGEEGKDICKCTMRLGESNLHIERRTLGSPKFGNKATEHGAQDRSVAVSFPICRYCIPRGKKVAENRCTWSNYIFKPMS